MKDKLYLVKREVRAKSLEEALTKDGEVYEIVLANDNYQNKEEPQIKGF